MTALGAAVKQRHVEKTVLDSASQIYTLLERFDFGNRNWAKKRLKKPWVMRITVIITCQAIIVRTVSE